MSQAKRRFKVTWCAEIPFIEGTQDRDIDSAVYKAQTFSTFEAATAFAQSIIRDRKDAFGCVDIEEQTVQVNQDIIEVEGRNVMQWTCVKQWIAADADEAPEEQPLF